MSNFEKQGRRIDDLTTELVALELENDLYRNALVHLVRDVGQHKSWGPGEMRATTSYTKAVELLKESGH